MKNNVENLTFGHFSVNECDEYDMLIVAGQKDYEMTELIDINLLDACMSALFPESYSTEFLEWNTSSDNVYYKWQFVNEEDL